MSLLPPYTHIVNPKLKHIYLSFDDKGNLIIKSPQVSHERIEKLLFSKSAWIIRSQKKFKDKKGKALDFRQEPELYFKGKAYPLTLIAHEEKSIKLDFDSEKCILYYQLYDEDKFQKYIDDFYKKEAQKCLPIYIKSWAKKMQLEYNKVSYRKTKRQWGSCSGKNNLSFNTMMMKLPEDVIQYIIVHELSHIVHKHHQKAFWAHVAHYLPEYKVQVQALKNYRT